MCHASILCTGRFKSAISFFSLLMLAGAPRAAEVLQSKLNTAVVPLISGRSVLYQDFVSRTYRLYLVDITGKNRTELRNNRTQYLWPLAFGGKHAAWIAYSSGSGGGGGMMKSGVVDIPGGPGSGDGGGGGGLPSRQYEYRVDIFETASKTTTTLTSSTAYKDFIAMDKFTVVWTDYRHATASDTFNEIYMCSVTGQNITRITDAVSYKADVYIKGERIVWQDYRNAETNAANADIYLYNTTDKSEKPICKNKAYQAQPCVYGDIVVWQDYRNAENNKKNADIYMYDLSKNEETQITFDKSYQGSPRIWGNYIVWQDYRKATGEDTANADIYLYDIENKTVGIVVEKEGYQSAAVVDANAAVWYDYYDRTIYMAYLDSTVASASTPEPQNRFERKPATHYSHLEFIRKYEGFGFYDIKGRKRECKHTEAATGIYFVAANDKTGVFMRKFVFTKP